MGELFVINFAFVECGVFRFGDVGAMRCVGGNVGEEGLSRIFLRLDPAAGLAEEDIGAIAFGLHKLAIVEDGGVEILVAGSIAAGAGIALSDAASAVDEHLGEATCGGEIFGFIAEMPLAENTGGVTCIA